MAPTYSPRVHMIATGTTVGLMDDTIEDIHTEDIVYSLARVERFNGQTQVPYYVSEHSLMVHRLVREMVDDPVIWLQALLHDATEAYIGDIPGPVKMLAPDLENCVEVPLWRRIARKYGVPEHMHYFVKQADKLALHLEAKELCPSSPLADWSRYPELEPLLNAWRNNPVGKVVPAEYVWVRERTFAGTLNMLIKETTSE